MAALTSDTAIRKWKPNQEGEARSVGGRLSLYVRGWKSGSKAFYFRTNTWLKMGDFPVLSLAHAREIALVVKRLRKQGFGAEALKRGFDGLGDANDFEMRVKRRLINDDVGIKAATYDDLWQKWFADIEPTLQEGPSRRRPRAIYELHIAPHIGNRPIDQIRRKEVYDLLAPLFRIKPTTAGHALGHLTKVFELAIILELCETNPVPPRSSFPKRITAKQHHGTLSQERLPYLWASIHASNASEAAKLAILTALTTAHRVGVVVRLERKHIDWDTGIWTVPQRVDKLQPGRMKSGREYSLMLPRPLLEQLTELVTQTSDNIYVFESPTTRGHISPNALLKLLKGFDETITVHGLRNAIKEFCRRSDPPVPDYIADAFCDHSLKGLDASYRRMDTFEQRAEVASRVYEFVCKQSEPLSNSR